MRKGRARGGEKTGGENDENSEQSWDTNEKMAISQLLGNK